MEHHWAALTPFWLSADNTIYATKFEQQITGEESVTEREQKLDGHIQEIYEQNISAKFEQQMTGEREWKIEIEMF